MEIWNTRHRQYLDCNHSVALTGCWNQILWLLFIWSVVLPAIICAAGCTDNSGRTVEETKLNTDLEGLKRLINLPGGVKSCEWQTGQRAAHGGDWWVAAVLDIDSEKIADFLQGPGVKEVFETPPGLELVSSFAALKSLPEVQLLEPVGIRLLIDTFSVTPYANSPLLNGKAVGLSPSQILVVLWTN